MRRLLPLVLLLLVCGCGAAVPEPKPPPAEVTPPERGDLKAATWREAAAVEAERLRRLAIAIRRAHRSRTVAGALRYALLTERIGPAAHARFTRGYEAARTALAKLEGARAFELATVLGVVDRLAAARALTPSRLDPAFLILDRNTRFWTHEPMPAAGERITHGAAVFQYYPGRGLQLQPLASWGRANWTAGSCLRAPRRCPRQELTRTLDALTALGSRRGGFLAWEHFFDWGGGTAPWISGMTQATAISALSRGAKALGRPRWRRAARRALDAFAVPPPTGVSGGEHPLMYSFAPGLRILNGELQAVNGIGEMAALTGDRAARRLFRRLERGVRATIAAADTGAWSLYSQAGREATLGYHQLVGRFLGDLCERTGRRTYCAAHRRFARYEREPTRIGIAPLRRLVARRAAQVRFSLSKVSSVKVRVWGVRGLSLSRDLDLPHGAHAVAWTPPSRGRYRVRIEAQGPSGPVGTADRAVRIVLPKPKPKRKAEKKKGGPPRRAAQKLRRAAGGRPRSDDG